MRVRLAQALSSGKLAASRSSLSRYSSALSTRFWPNTGWRRAGARQDPEALSSERPPESTLRPCPGRRGSRSTGPGSSRPIGGQGFPRSLNGGPGLIDLLGLDEVLNVGQPRCPERRDPAPRPAGIPCRPRRSVRQTCKIGRGSDGRRSWSRSRERPAEPSAMPRSKSCLRIASTALTIVISSRAAPWSRSTWATWSISSNRLRSLSSPTSRRTSDG